jgi:anti-sigma factor RsiW
MSSGKPASLDLPENRHRRVGSAIHTFLETIDDIQAALKVPPAQGLLALFDGDLPEELTHRMESRLQDIHAQVADLARVARIRMQLSVRRRISSSASYAWTVAGELTAKKHASSDDVEPATAAEISARARRLADCFVRLACEADAAGSPASESEAVRG